MLFEDCAVGKTKSNRLQVHFGDRVGIKQYNIVPGDNPGCSSGVPIQLGWNIESVTEQNFYFYEHFRSSERLRGKQLKIPPMERERMLIAAGFTDVDYSRARDRANVFREERRQDSQKNQGWDRFSLLILKQTNLDGLPVKEALVHGTTKGQGGDECTPMLDRFRRSFSLRRERSIRIKDDERLSSTDIVEANSGEHEPSGGGRGGQRCSSLRRERSVRLGGNTEAGGALLGRSFSLRLERSIDDTSSTKSSLTTGFWKKATGESHQVFPQGNRRPTTKSARSA